MSAIGKRAIFIVSNTTMDHAIVAIRLYLKKGQSEHKKNLSEMSNDELGRALFRMNCDAVNAVYREDNKVGEDYIWHDRLKTWPKPLHLDVGYSALSCLQYQCWEEGIMKLEHNKPFAEVLNAAKGQLQEMGCSLSNPCVPYNFPDKVEDQSFLMKVAA